MGKDASAERVLVLPAERFASVGAFEGFRPHSADYLAALLDPSHLSFRPRAEVETDPGFKQLIPYVVLRCGGELFHYTRGKSGTEARLRALRSVGIGGHISEEDAGPARDPYRAGMLRELAEEVAIAGGHSESCLGFIYDPRSFVGSVHLGVVHLFELDEPKVTPRESAIAEAGFAPLAELRKQREAFETWSQFVLDVLG